MAKRISDAITDYAVGDQVILTPERLQVIENAHRSIHHYPGRTYMAKIRPLVGQQGEVTHRFPPGYEMSVRFGEQSFHMKDSWVEPAVPPTP